MTDLVASVSEALVGRGLRLALAESCTGGLVAAQLTDRPGSSRFLDAGLVTYSNAAKASLLGVDPAVIDAHGAVSEAVVRAMLEGARRVTGADAAIAITGIAGPDGGTAEKPVGTVWIAAGVADAVRVVRFQFQGDRGAVREAAATAALDMLLETVEESR